MFQACWLKETEIQLLIGMGTPVVCQRSSKGLRKGLRRFEKRHSEGLGMTLIKENPSEHYMFSCNMLIIMIIFI